MFGIGKALKKAGRWIDKKIQRPLAATNPVGAHRQAEKNRKKELAQVQAQHDEQMGLLAQQQRIASQGIDAGLENTPEIVIGGGGSVGTRRKRGSRTSGTIATSLGIS